MTEHILFIQSRVTFAELSFKALHKFAFKKTPRIYTYVTVGCLN